MSIINKMHQDLAQQEQPILAEVGEKKGRKKLFIGTLILLLITSSVVLSYLIFNQTGGIAETGTQPATKAKPLIAPPLENPSLLVAEPVQQNSVLQPTIQPVVREVVTQAPGSHTESASAALNNSLPTQTTEPEVNKKESRKAENTAEKAPAPVIAEKRMQVTAQSVTETSSVNLPSPQKKEAVLEEAAPTSSLEIKPVKLNKAQLAQVYLKQAKRAAEEGNLELAAEKRAQALVLVPTLNEVRKSLALYYYGIGRTEKAQALLQQGARIAPTYSDFNLMLSRIALKAGDNQKAYLYLEQHPPAVEGHLDYYASHAILAQKFHKYEQSARLYESLLSQRPNNGRWRMSLAIAQDKQGKVAQAIGNYQKALLQTDLSLKAKAYINQRLAYLETTL